MNTLSWFLLFVDVYANLKWAAPFVFLVTLVGWAAYAIFISLDLASYYMKENPFRKGTGYHDKEFNEEARNIAQATAWFDGKKWWPPLKVLSLVIFAASFWLLTPSVQTLYLVASSEAAEMVVFSEEGKAVLQDLREVLDAQLEALKSPITTK